MARWVQTTSGALAIIVHEVGDSCLIRYAEKRGGYHWRGRAELTRRRDWDAAPEPDWLQRARRSTRPPRILWPLLHDDDRDAEEPTRPGFQFDTDPTGRPIS